MRCYKCRPRVTGEDAISLLKQRLLSKLGSMEAPLRMSCQLFKALVVRIDGKEECFGIADVHHHRQTKIPGKVKDWRQAFVIDPEQLA